MHLNGWCIELENTNNILKAANQHSLVTALWKEKYNGVEILEGILSKKQTHGALEKESCCLMGYRAKEDRWREMMIFNRYKKSDFDT